MKVSHQLTGFAWTFALFQDRSSACVISTLQASRVWGLAILVACLLSASSVNPLLGVAEEHRELKTPDEAIWLRFQSPRLSSLGYDSN